MKLPPCPHYFVNDVRYFSESVAVREAQQIANEEDSPVRVFIKRTASDNRRPLVVVQPQTEGVPA